jgi:hypothetical protein
MIKIYRVLHCGILIWLMAFTNYARSHEFWIEPIDFSPDIEQNIVANIKVGQNFKGSGLAFMPANFETFELILGNIQTRKDPHQAVDSRFGDIPAVDQKANGIGINILSYVSGDATVVYSSAQKFGQFLEKEGLNWVLEEHKKRGLPESGFTEAYQRFSKSLIAVDNTSGDDHPIGLLFEWIIETNPYREDFSEEKTITAQLLWQGKPFAGSRAAVFTKLEESTSQNIYTTDINGRIKFPAIVGAIYMISAVNMVEPSVPLTLSTQAVWKSLWASTTFKVPNKQ